MLTQRAAWLSAPSRLGAEVCLDLFETNQHSEHLELSIASEENVIAVITVYN